MNQLRKIEDLRVRKDGKFLVPIGQKYHDMTGARHIIDARKYQERGIKKVPYYINAYGVMRR